MHPLTFHPFLGVSDFNSKSETLLYIITTLTTIKYVDQPGEPIEVTNLRSQCHHSLQRLAPVVIRTLQERCQRLSPSV